MYLRPGERVTVEELLYGLLLCSGNDAAEALADGCGGTASFVRRMNGLAGELGMEDTSFENPSGLDGQAHYSTARDMAVWRPMPPGTIPLCACAPPGALPSADAP